MSCSFQSVNSYWSKWLCYVCCRKPQNKTWNGHWRCLIWFDSSNRRLSWNYKIQNLQFKLKKYRLSEENNANKHSEMLDAYLQGIFGPYVQHREEKMTNKHTKHSFFKAHKLWKVNCEKCVHRDHETHTTWGGYGGARHNKLSVKASKSLRAKFGLTEFKPMTFHTREYLILTCGWITVGCESQSNGWSSFAGRWNCRRSIPRVEYSPEML